MTSPRPLTELKKSADCEHKNRAGGNDYIECNDCGLMWDYRRETAEQALLREALTRIEQLEKERDKERLAVLVLRGRAEQAEQQLAAARAEIARIEEEEAFCCPEDVGFSEYIRTLQQQLAAERQARAQMEAALRPFAAMVHDDGVEAPYPEEEWVPLLQAAKDALSTLRAAVNYCEKYEHSFVVGRCWCLHCGVCAQCLGNGAMRYGDGEEDNCESCGGLGRRGVASSSTD